MDGRRGNHEQARQVDAVVVGAGFAGLYMLYRLRDAGWDAQGFEAGHDVGGTWYWNRYPGARCDVESLEYSYSFDEALQQEWEWTERYAGQPEILRYLEHVADRFDLRSLIRFDTRVAAARFDETTDSWTVHTDDGAATTARFLIMATGCLSSANMPDIPGVDSFGGEIFHTGRWPHDGVDFAGKRVGVIGTGSSAIQSIPIIAEAADHLVVFQRTPAYSVPAHNGPLDPQDVAAVKRDYAGLRERNRQSVVGFGSRTATGAVSALEVDDEARTKEFEARWGRGGLLFLGAYNDLLLTPESNELVAEFVRDKIRATVKDAAVAEKLVPTQVIGCKRLCVDTNYYETYNRPNVELVDISAAPVDAITPTGVRANGSVHELDTIVFATGFDAMTGALNRIDIRGRGGQSLAEAWSAGPITYLGLGVPDFPNIFVITGPGSPSVLTNMVTSIEHHVGWISDCLAYLRDSDQSTIEAKPDAAAMWVGYVNSVADLTLYPQCNSWYLGANVPGKPRVFMPLPGLPPYVEQCAAIAANGYDGFTLTPATASAPA